MKIQLYSSHERKISMAATPKHKYSCIFYGELGIAIFKMFLSCCLICNVVRFYNHFQFKLGQDKQYLWLSYHDMKHSYIECRHSWQMKWRFSNQYLSEMKLKSWWMYTPGKFAFNFTRKITLVSSYLLNPPWKGSTLKGNNLLSQDYKEAPTSMTELLILEKFYNSDNFSAFRFAKPLLKAISS